MAALPGILGLLVFIYMRPHEFVPALSQLPVLYLFLALAVIGLALDLGARRARLRKTPQLLWTFAFVGWCFFTVAIHDPRALATNAVTLLVCLALYLVIAHGIQTVASFKRTVVVLFALGLFVAVVGVEQRHAPTECVVFNPMDRGQNAVSDGRACVNERDGELVDGTGECYDGGQQGLAYACEHVGLFGTTSIGGGRVRYLGVLTDPNELALATSIAIPFAFAFYEQKRNALRLALLVATLGVVATEIVYTQSRGGQIVLGAVLGAYFIRLYCWKRGAVVGAVLAVPLVLLGGRKGEDADASSLERLEAAGAGLKMLLHGPVTGVGYAQFAEHHYLTAHNAYILAGGELGAVGVFLFAAILYLSVKIPATVLLTEFDNDEMEGLKPYAMATLAAFTGVLVGIFFLSWTYHYVLWIHIGLAGALYSVVKAREPEFVVKPKLVELALVFFAVMALLGAMAIYVRYKEAW